MTHPSNTPAANVAAIFTYHAPTGDQPQRYERLRAAAKLLALEIAACVPECADRTAALRHLRECVMTANAAIALENQGETAAAGHG